MPLSPHLVDHRSGPERRPLHYRTMGCYREKTSAFFTRLGYGLGVERRPAIVPPPRSLGPPAPQTSLSMSSSWVLCIADVLIYPIFAVFELPDELMLLILSFISPGPWLTGHYSRFRAQYGIDISDCHRRRMEFLRPLSMTCRSMRLRLLPWIWERLEVSPQLAWGYDRGLLEPLGLVRRLNAIGNILHANVFLATNVKYVWPCSISLGRG